MGWPRIGVVWPRKGRRPDREHAVQQQEAADRRPKMGRPSAGCTEYPKAMVPTEGRWSTSALRCATPHSRRGTRVRCRRYGGATGRIIVCVNHEVVYPNGVAIGARRSLSSSFPASKNRVSFSRLEGGRVNVRCASRLDLPPQNRRVCDAGRPASQS